MLGLEGTIAGVSHKGDAGECKGDAVVRNGSTIVPGGVNAHRDDTIDPLPGVCVRIEDTRCCRVGNDKVDASLRKGDVGPFHKGDD